ncbi:MAG: hypothetical protein FWD15_01215 [Alphaproteobacteria bacterium]|nr:hypothetical protein [Alphaproteobacteria bacterium]
MNRFEFNINYAGKGIIDCAVDCKSCLYKPERWDRSNCVRLQPHETVDGAANVGLYLTNEAKDCAVAAKVGSSLVQKYNGGALSISIPKTKSGACNKIEINLFVPEADMGGDYIRSLVGKIATEIERFDITKGATMASLKGSK